MAVRQTNLDFNWRDPTNYAVPQPLDNSLVDYGGGNGEEAVKCYRNVILTWLFHTPLLLNWIDDNHPPPRPLPGQVCQPKERRTCRLCDLRDLARRFWKETRDKTFNSDVDEFWKQTHNPGLIPVLTEQNDAEEYMQSLMSYLSANADSRWINLIQVSKQCLSICRRCKYKIKYSDVDTDLLLQGTISTKKSDYEPLSQAIRLCQTEQRDCKNENCPSKTEELKAGGNSRPNIDFYYGLRVAPPILAIHCKPEIRPAFAKDGSFLPILKGKIKRLEHYMTFSTYAGESFGRNAMNWNFYHLYGVILRIGNTGNFGHYVCAFEQRQTGQWLFFDDSDPNEGPKTTELSRSKLDKKVEEMQGGAGSVFMLLYRKLFEVPLRLLDRYALPTRAIALQDQQALDDSGLPGLDKKRAEADQAEKAKKAEKAKAEGAKAEGAKAEGAKAAEAKAVEAKAVEAKAVEAKVASLPTEQGAETAADAEPAAFKPAPGQTRDEKQVVDDNVSREDSKELVPQTSQAEQPQPTEQDKISEQPKKRQAKGKATKRARDKAMDENDEASTTVPASEAAKTGVKSTTQPKKREAKAKTTKKAPKEASDSQKDEKPAPPAKKAKPAVEPSVSDAAYVGRETRSRARAKRARSEIADADQTEKDETATSDPAPKKARTTKKSAPADDTRTKHGNN